VPDHPRPASASDLTVIRVHHVGIVVRDARAAAETYQRALGLEPLAQEDYRGTARVVFLRAGDAMLEMIEPLTEETMWAAALRERGEGVHHVALQVDDLHTAIETLTAKGTRFLQARPSRAPGNTLSIFLDPATTGGPLIELVQEIVV
jgi:methylmalonyl-CoA epimerase